LAKFSALDPFLNLKQLAIGEVASESVSKATKLLRRELFRATSKVKSQLEQTHQDSQAHNPLHFRRNESASLISSSLRVWERSE